MKISVNDEHLFTLSETQKKVMQHVVHSDLFEDDMKRRLRWVLTHAYEVWFKQFKEEWEPKLAEHGIKMIPTDQEEFAELVFSQPDYKNRTQREEAAKIEKALSDQKLIDSNTSTNTDTSITINEPAKAVDSIKNIDKPKGLLKKLKRLMSFNR